MTDREDFGFGPNKARVMVQESGKTLPTFLKELKEDNEKLRAQLAKAQAVVSACRKVVTMCDHYDECSCAALCEDALIKRLKAYDAEGETK
jgi:hypothetical protein